MVKYSFKIMSENYIHWTDNFQKDIGDQVIALMGKHQSPGYIFKLHGKINVTYGATSAGTYSPMEALALGITQPVLDRPSQDKMLKMNNKGEVESVGEAKILSQDLLFRTRDMKGFQRALMEFLAIQVNTEAEGFFVINPEITLSGDDETADVTFESIVLMFLGANIRPESPVVIGAGLLSSNNALTVTAGSISVNSFDMYVDVGLLFDGLNHDTEKLDTLPTQVKDLQQRYPVPIDTLVDRIDIFCVKDGTDFDATLDDDIIVVEGDKSLFVLDKDQLQIARTLMSADWADTPGPDNNPSFPIPANDDNNMEFINVMNKPHVVEQPSQLRINFKEGTDSAFMFVVPIIKYKTNTPIVKEDGKLSTAPVKQIVSETKADPNAREAIKDSLKMRVKDIKR